MYHLKESSRAKLRNDRRRAVQSHTTVETWFVTQAARQIARQLARPLTTELSLFLLTIVEKHRKDVVGMQVLSCLPTHEPRARASTIALRLAFMAEQHTP